jgi:pimeloyl-[acyl-carrier protein] methyl ester esterase
MNLHLDIRGYGRPLVFFHGWGFDHKVWLQLATSIASQYQLCLVDLPGYGLSSPMHWDLFKKLLLQQLPERFALVGWSMGGLFATRLAIEEPRRVTHLINISSSPRFIKEESWPGIDKTVFEDFFANLARDLQQTIKQFVNLQLKNQSYQHDNQQGLELTSLHAGLQILADWDLREPLHYFAKPACFMFGRLDAITPRTIMGVMQKIYPHFDYVMFAKAAHMPFLSHQEEFITVLKEILRNSSEDNLKMANGRI